MLKTLSSSIFILVFILFLEILFVSIYTLSVPNQLVFTALDNFNFYSNLLSVNPAMAIEIAFIGNPVFIVQRLDQLQGNQIWGVYFMPVNILVLFLLSLYISIVKKVEMTLLQWIWILLAASILLFSMFYLRIQTCCTSGPTWLLDIWLFSQVSSPLADTALWQEIYIQLSGHFTLIQWGIAAIAVIVLYSLQGRINKKTP